MKLTTTERELIETVLDRLFLLGSKNPEYRARDAQDYERAIRLVRDPAAGRRIRSDEGRPRKGTLDIELDDAPSPPAA